MTAAPYIEHTGELPDQPLILEVYPPDRRTRYRGSTQLYEDDGVSLAYHDDVYSWTKIDYKFDPESRHRLTVHPPAGPYDKSMLRNGLRVRLVHAEQPGFVMVDGVAVHEVGAAAGADGDPPDPATPSWGWTPEERVLEIVLPGDRSRQSIAIEIGPEKERARLSASPSE